MRLFLAAELPPAIQRTLDAIQTQVRDALQDTRYRVTWVRPTQMHLTLRFFADVADVDVGRLQDGMDAACHALSSFTARLAGLGVFPESGPPRVMWLGVAAGREALEALARELTAALAARGWPAEERAFHPHVTLGRMKDAGPRRELVAALQRCHGVMSEPFTVAGLVLIQSTLTPRGAEHTRIYRTTLRSHT